MHVLRYVTRCLTLGALAVLATASAALAGPPWISIEYPANPHGPATRGALFIVHSYHHGDALATRLTGVAEGLVDGRRVAVPLDITATAQPGVFAVRGTLAAEGVWVLAVSLKEGDGATALVTMGPDNRVVAVKVPHDVNREGWTVPRRVSDAEIERELVAAAKWAAPLPTASPERAGGRALAIAGLLPLGLLLAGWAAAPGGRQGSA
jgi:hypothetical protein